MVYKIGLGFKKESPFSGNLCALTDEAINLLNLNVNYYDPSFQDFLMDNEQHSYILKWFADAKKWQYTTEQLKHIKQFGLYEAKELVKEFKEYKILKEKEELDKEFYE